MYPQILPKKEQRSSFLLLFGKRTEFICSFFGRFRGYQKSFRSYLTFKKVPIIHSINVGFDAEVAEKFLNGIYYSLAETEPWRNRWTFMDGFTVATLLMLNCQSGCIFFWKTDLAITILLFLQNHNGRFQLVNIYKGCYRSHDLL